MIYTRTMINKVVSSAKASPKWDTVRQKVTERMLSKLAEDGRPNFDSFTEEEKLQLMDSIRVGLREDGDMREWREHLRAELSSDLHSTSPDTPFEGVTGSENVVRDKRFAVICQHYLLKLPHLCRLLVRLVGTPVPNHLRLVIWEYCLQHAVQQDGTSSPAQEPRPTHAHLSHQCRVVLANYPALEEVSAIPQLTQKMSSALLSWMDCGGPVGPEDSECLLTLPFIHLSHLTGGNDGSVNDRLFIQFMNQRPWFVKDLSLPVSFMSLKKDHSTPLPQVASHSSSPTGS